MQTQRGIVPVKGSGERRVGGKTNVAAKDREAGSHPGRARQAPRGAGRRNAPFDGSRAGSQNGEVFTGRVVSALGAASMTWAAAEGSASRRIEEARQARQVQATRTAMYGHFGGVKPLGARTLAPPKKRDGWRTRNRKSPRARGNDLVENERDTGARVRSSKMAETDRTHRACGTRNGASRCVKPVR